MPAGPITLYASPGCPDGQALRACLEQHHLPYTERDVTGPGVRDEAKQRYGARVAPITVADEDTFFFGPFDQQFPKLRAHGAAVARGAFIRAEHSSPTV